MSSRPLKLLFDRAKADLASGRLTESDLDELYLEASRSPVELRQRLLYLNASQPSIRSPLYGCALHEPVRGSVTEIDPLAEELPYACVHDAILDGWRVIHFPDQRAPFDDREIDVLGYEFILEKWEADHELEPERLLSDDEVLRFVTHGYHLVETDLPADFHESIREQLARIRDNPGNEILALVPDLQVVYDRPAVRGALASLLGSAYRMNGHRHLHVNPPGSRSQNWHQDGTNVRHHQVRTVLAMYYPHDVPPEMGPTVILPGSHFRNAPTDRMAAHANLRGQVFLTVKAGTVAITHYDLWHAATRNRTDRERYMLKFLFDRTADPDGPSWAHDPDGAKAAAARRIGEMVGPNQFYNSDFYKEWGLRKEMWNWMLGSSLRVPPGGFKDMLS